jgi:hypothetical protein
MNANALQESDIRAEEHPPRFDWAKFTPEIYKVMIRLDTAARRGVGVTLLNLVKIRVIQLNARNRFGVATRVVPGHYTPAG